MISHELFLIHNELSFCMIHLLCYLSAYISNLTITILILQECIEIPRESTLRKKVQILEIFKETYTVGIYKPKIQY